MSELSEIALNDARIAVIGALHVERAVDRIRLRRLPDWTAAQSPEAAFDLMAAMTSGVRLAFATDADRLEIDLLPTGLRFAGEARRPVMVDLRVDGALLAAFAIDGGNTIEVDGARIGFTGGAVATVRADLPRGGGAIEVWLPHAAMTEIVALRLPAGASLAAPVAQAQRWAHYGSSISHGMEAAGPSRTWPALAAARAGLELTNLGFAGQCHIDGFVARAIRDAAFDLVSLKLGANVTAADSMRRRTFAPAVHAFLDTIREAHKDLPILLISPIHSPLLEDRPGPVLRHPGPVYRPLERPHAVVDGGLGLTAIREILADIVARRRAAGDERLHLLDGWAMFGPSDVARMPDGLHPDNEGHAAMADRFYAEALAPGRPLARA